MAVSFHKRPGRGRSSAGQVRRYQPAGQDAAQVRPHGHRSGQPHRRVAAPTPGGGRGTAGCGHPALRKHHWWCPATSGNPSVTAAPCQLPLHKGAFGTGDADCRVGPAGLLAMTVLILCHSEASAHTGRGNPSFLRWTGVRAAVPRAWPPPAKFRPQHRAAASSAPTKRRDSCRNHPSQRRTAERLRRGREGWAGIGAKTIPKGGPPRDRLGSA